MSARSNFQQNRTTTLRGAIPTRKGPPTRRPGPSEDEVRWAIAKVAAVPDLSDRELARVHLRQFGISRSPVAIRKWVAAATAEKEPTP